MQVSALTYTPIVAGKAVQRVQPVSAIVRYPEADARDAHQYTRETTLEGEFLRGTGTAGGNAAAAHQTAIPGMLVNAARAVSAYTAVATATAADAPRARRRLDVHV